MELRIFREQVHFQQHGKSDLFAAFLWKLMEVLQGPQFLQINVAGFQAALRIFRETNLRFKCHEHVDSMVCLEIFVATGTAPKKWLLVLSLELQVSRTGKSLTTSAVFDNFVKAFK